MYENSIYAGVLGKIIGVYFGRPVEGWKYEEIKKQFGYVDHFLHAELNTDLIEVDDDISGTFNFVRSLENNDISYESISDFWKNTIIENKTIFWWGGLFRSTEHTAFWRLKNGYDAPESGSAKLNGKIVSTQIGSQIFIDGFGLANPNQPEKAKRMSMISASVSHDLIAVDMAAYIAVLESIVFEEKDIRRALYKALEYFENKELRAYIDEIIQVCNQQDDYQTVRDYIEQNHSYKKYGGNCPIVTNFMVIISSLLLDKDDFKTAISIATSMGYDTDCNAGNVGCIEGVRLGLKSINASGLREAVNEQMYVVQAIGSRVFTNATNVAKEIVERKSLGHQYTFDFEGSTCGFEFENITYSNRGKKLEIYTKSNGKMSVKTFYDPRKYHNAGYEIVATPNLYFGQTIHLNVEGAIPYTISVSFINQYEEVEILHSPVFVGSSAWTLPSNYGYVICKVNIEFIESGTVTIHSIDFKGIPEIRYENLFAMSPNYIVGRTIPSWYFSFIDATSNSTIDHLSTICLSHEYDDGLLYTGDVDMDNYQVEAVINVSMQKSVGIIGRMVGLEKYYQLIVGNGFVRLERRSNKNIAVFKELPFVTQEDEDVFLKMEFIGNAIRCFVNDQIFEVKDEMYSFGMAGLTISEGSCLIKKFSLNSI